MSIVDSLGITLFVIEIEGRQGAFFGVANIDRGLLFAELALRKPGFHITPFCGAMFATITPMRRVIGCMCDQPSGDQQGGKSRYDLHMMPPLTRSNKAARAE